MQFDVLVEVSPRRGWPTRRGQTIERSLPALGYEGVAGVRVGKAIRFRVDAATEAAARSEVEDMCARFLTNPVIEDSTVSLTEVA